MDEFRRLLAQRGEELYRSMPWREDTRPYYVLVSELMLQQTQVSRVIPKFDAFIARFPDEVALASASLAEVVQLWQGLGYNRRAKFLHLAAQMIVQEFEGAFPTSVTDILRLPGVGKNTAGAILAYAFNTPAVFVETNVRTVYIHHFFADNFSVTDKEIEELVEATIDRENPRRFYQNLMDYGTWLKASGVRNIAQSHHYKKQSPLKGSVREIRGQIVALLASGELSETSLRQALPHDERYAVALAGLIRDGLVTQSHNRVRLAA
ncbi:MAG: hypothetical protein WBP22_05985 [Candidatus Saccharimonas sp.]